MNCPELDADEMISALERRIDRLAAENRAMREALESLIAVGGDISELAESFGLRNYGSNIVSIAQRALSATTPEKP